MSIRRVPSLLLSLSVLSATPPGLAQADAETVEWSALRWETRGAVELAEHLGRPAMRFGSGVARLVGDDFENGTIEYDVAVEGARSFTGVTFRNADDGYEHFYIRPHQTGRFDAVQYTPDFHDLSAWQLFPEHNAPAELPRDRWIHVRLVVAGSKLTAWVGDDAEPVLEVETLRRGPGAGGLELTSFVPGATTGSLPNAYSNFTLARSDRAVDWKPIGSPAADSGFVREWSVSTPVAGPETPVEALPSDLAARRWSTLAADERGRVNLARLAGKPSGEPRGLVYARVRVRSDRTGTKRLDFGFSDKASVFVNGRLLFTGNNSYRSRSLRYLGVMTVDNDALRIPLVEGDNEIVFAVIESFGGWGLTARFPDPSGLAVTAR